MFKRVGKEIKTWAQILFILQLIVYVLCGIAVPFAVASMDSDFLVLGIVAGLLVIAIGYLLARLSVIMLYSWGEAVDRLQRIDEKLEKLEKQPAPMAVPAAPAAPASYSAPSHGYAAPAKPAAAPSAPAPAVPVKSAPVNVDSAPKPIYNAPARSGASGEWTCPSCGQVNKADGNWCRNCGSKKN